MPSFTRVAEGRGQIPDKTATAELQVYNLTCRGNASLFGYFLERDDIYEVAGYLKIEAWPGPGATRVRIIYDATLTDEAAIKEALTGPYYDAAADIWRSSPFEIVGYDAVNLFGNEASPDEDSPETD